MRADEIIQKISQEKGFKPNYSQLSKILNISRQSIGYYKEKDFPQEHIKTIEKYYHISFEKKESSGATEHDFDCHARF